MKLKKVILTALAAMMVLGAAGCGSQQSDGGKQAAVKGSITGSGSSALLSYRSCDAVPKCLSGSTSYLRV